MHMIDGRSGQPPDAGASNVLLVVAAEIPWPPRSGSLRRLATLLDSLPFSVQLVVRDRPADVTERSGEMSTPWGRPRRLFRRGLAIARWGYASPGELRWKDAPAALHTLIAGDIPIVAVHLDTIATGHLARPLRRALNLSGRPDVPVIGSWNDSYSLLTEGTQANSVWRFVVSNWLKVVERRIAALCDVVVVVSDVDAQWLQARCPTTPVAVVPLSWPEWAPRKFASRADRHFDVTVFSSRPGLAEFLRFGVPRLREQVPDASIVMVGPEPHREVRKLLSGASVEYLGFVRDLASHLSRTAVAVAPSQQRSGTPNRMIECATVGTPIVGGRCLQGVPGAVSGVNCIVSMGASDIGSQAAEVLSSDSLWHRLVRGGDQLWQNAPDEWAIRRLYIEAIALGAGARPTT